MTNNCVSTVFGLLGVLAALTFPVTPGNAAEAQTVLGGKLVVVGYATVWTARQNWRVFRSSGVCRKLYPEATA